MSDHLPHKVGGKWCCSEHEQPDDNDIGRFHRNAPDTERDAAILVYPRTGDQRRRIILFMATQKNGATDWEITKALAMVRTGAGARRNELVKRGWLRDSGGRRRGPYGAPNIVWELTDRARGAVAGLIEEEAG